MACAVHTVKGATPFLQAAQSLVQEVNLVPPNPRRFVSVQALGAPILKPATTILQPLRMMALACLMTRAVSAEGTTRPAVVAPTRLPAITTLPHS